MRPLTVDSITKILVDAGIMTPDQRLEATIKERVQRHRLLSDARKLAAQTRTSPPSPSDISPVDIIAGFGFPRLGAKRGEKVDEETVMRALADSAGLEFVRIDPLKLDAQLITKVVSRPFARRHSIIPLSLDKRLLTVATANPSDDEMVRNLRAVSTFDIRPVVSTKSDILKTITEFYGFRTSVKAAEKELRPGVDLGNLEQLVQLQTDRELEATDKHVINAVEYLLRYAYDQRASDVHIEPKREQSVIRLRIDGVLHNVHTMPRVVHNAIVSRIKMLARLDIAERRLPQDGRFKTTAAGEEVELRVSTLPVAFGEKTVLRIFDPERSSYDIQDLGFFERERRLFLRMLERPHGMILVTGPTGSGKTTTLYAGMRMLSSDERNVTSLEDPIEMVFEEFNQVLVQPKIGITFASALRHVLRQDPDVIMVGEIRDAETATNAVQAALTGHLVMSTLHTNDAIEALTRLADLGIEPFLVASSLTGVVAQRLLRTICVECKRERKLDLDEWRALGLRDTSPTPMMVYEGEGCTRCRGTGYYGRTSVVEMFEVTDEVASLIRRSAGADKVRKAAIKDGMRSLREAAVLKMIKGETTFEEVVRVTTSPEALSDTADQEPILTAQPRARG
ncbi:MAG: type II/IV secretion system protein [Deltaproteobacteria bacterium]|nr:type II/IV secretion system protein [Deltaproteobacteria bacterium]